MGNQTQVGVALLPVSAQGQVLLGLRKSPHGQETWSPPGGHVEFGEDPGVTVCREMVEETGLHVTDPHFVDYTSDVFADSGKHYVTLFFLARLDVDQPARVMEPEKWAEWRWFYADELPVNLFLPFAHFVQKIGGPAGLRHFMATAPRKCA